MMNYGSPEPTPKHYRAYRKDQIYLVQSCQPPQSFRGVDMQTHDEVGWVDIGKGYKAFAVILVNVVVTVFATVILLRVLTLGSWSLAPVISTFLIASPLPIAFGVFKWRNWKLSEPYNFRSRSCVVEGILWAYFLFGVSRFGLQKLYVGLNQQRKNLKIRLFRTELCGKC